LSWENLKAREAHWLDVRTGDPIGNSGSSDFSG
jgi:hypothetical protein